MTQGVLIPATTTTEANKSTLGVQVRGSYEVTDEGVFRTVFGEASTATHRHVAEGWQDHCVPLCDLFYYQRELAKLKYDNIKPESEVRLTKDLRLPNGIPLNSNGMSSLREFAGVPSSMERFLLGKSWYAPSVTQEAREDYVKWLNSGLDDREVSWANKRKPARKFKLRFRTVGNNDLCRAVLSDSYASFDNIDAVTMITECIQCPIADALCSNVYDDGDRMDFSVLLPDSMKQEPDSQWGVGFKTQNSEVGDGSFEIMPFLFRGISRTGYTLATKRSKTTIRLIHRGKIEFSQVRGKVKTAIANALEHANKLLILIGVAREIPVEDVRAFIVVASKELGLSQDDVRGWTLRYMNTKHLPFIEGNVFGMVQSLADYATTISDNDSRTFLEIAATRMLTSGSLNDADSLKKRVEVLKSRGALLQVDDPLVTVVTAAMAQLKLS